jgi:hypothetical protein
LAFAHHGFEDPAADGAAVRPSAGRVAGRALVAALLALLVLAAAGAPPAAGQDASPSVDVTGDSEGTLAVDRPGTFVFSVKNTSPSLPGPGSNVEARVVVRVDGAPSGWTVGVSPNDFRLAAGATQRVDVQVAVAPGAPEAANLTVVADLYSALEGLERVLGEVPGGTQHASDGAPLRLRVDNTLTRDVLEALGAWVYALIVLLLVAVIVAVAVTVSSRRSLVRLVSDTRERAVAPGGKVAFPFRVEGLARETDTVLLQVSATMEGWAAFLPVPELVVEPGQSQDVSLVVIAPRAATPGTRQAILVTATSARAPKGAANLEFVAQVEAPLEFVAERKPKA